jgi:hypothetical protein
VLKSKSSIAGNTTTIIDTNYQDFIKEENMKEYPPKKDKEEV